MDTCPICKDVYEKIGDSYTLICNHAFHTECLKEWVEIHNECPMCRTEISVHRLGEILKKTGNIVLEYAEPYIQLPEPAHTRPLPVYSLFAENNLSRIRENAVEITIPVARRSRRGRRSRRRSRSDDSSSSGSSDNGQSFWTGERLVHY